MKIYLVIDAISGEDYFPNNEPNLLLLTNQKERAKTFFDDEIENWEDDLENFDSNITDCGNGLLYECTDFEGDSHRMIKLIEVEL